jgi:pimeloyl-ACP methyl ester carboxylesterase
LFGSGRNWSTPAQRLGTAHHVFALDARNHGVSPWADSMTYADMTEDVQAFQAARGLGPAAIIGHSMGGKTAMLLALNHAESVERLVIVDVAPVPYPPELAAYVRAMRAVDLAGVSRRAEVDAQLAGAITSQAERAVLLQNLVLENGQARWRLNLPVLDRFMPEISGFPEPAEGVSFAGPALFVAGERSSYVRPEYRPAIERLFPRGRIVQVPEAGHWLRAERPDAFLALVTPFLAND